MGRNDTDRTAPELEGTARLGPADGVLFDAFDDRLVDLELYVTAAGTLIATEPNASSVVKLEATDRGLVAAETTAVDLDAEELDRLDRVEPAARPDVDARDTIRSRLRGD